MNALKWLARAVVAFAGVTATLTSSVVAAPQVSASLAQIDALIGEAACRNDGDCRVIGVGALACGGPEGYRAWSIRQTDAGALEDLVARQAAARRLELERLGMLSTCAIVPVPGVVCLRTPSTAEPGRCTLAGPGNKVSPDPR